MHLNILIITKYKWRTRTQKHEEIRRILEPGFFESITIDTAILDVGKPEIKEGRIMYEWFEKNISTYAKARGYNHVIFQFSLKDTQEWGIQDNLRGSNLRDNDYFGESWVAADENTVVRMKDGTKWNQYVKTCAHEIGHELTRRGITTLEMHDYDYKDYRNNLEQFYIDMGRIVSLTEKVTALKSKLQQLLRTGSISDLQPLVKRKAEVVMEEMRTLGEPVLIAEGFRSIERQNKLYAQGRTAPGNIVTQAKGGESLHNYGVAVDFIFEKERWDAPDLKWKLLGAVAKKHGFEWGGDWTGFQDRPHVELLLGYTLADFKNGKVDYKKYV